MTSTPLTSDEVLTTTRSVRKRLDLSRPVPLALIRECIEIALQAPSGSNSQQWQWLVITDAGQRAAVGEVYRRAYAGYQAYLDQAGEPYPDDPDRGQVQTRINDSSSYLGDHLGEVPVLVVPCLDVRQTGLPDGNQAGLWGSILPAAWSYCLAARSRGLGTAWTSMALRYEPELAEIFGLPAGIAQAALLPTAYYTGDTFKPASRVPLDEVLHLDRW